MKTNYFVRSTHPRLLLFPTVTIYLLMDKIQPSDIIWGVVGAVWGIILIFNIITVCMSKGIDLLEALSVKENKSKEDYAQELLLCQKLSKNKAYNFASGKSKFQSKMDEMLKEAKERQNNKDANK